MQRLRREFLATGASIAALGMAGCQTSSGDDSEGASAQTNESEGEGSGSPPAGSASVAVATEWNAMRARIRDALALGLAEEYDVGAAVAQSTFERFEVSSGEHGAHEMLEHTSEDHYEGFEEALDELRTEGLEAGDGERIREEVDLASTHLRDAQGSIVEASTGHAFDLQLLGASVLDAAALATAGHFDGAHATAEAVLAQFEDASVHDALESANQDIYETFEHSVEAVASAAESETNEDVQAEAASAYSAAIDGSYELAASESAAGAGHLATLQARGWDAAAVASLGGPSTDFAHAAALTLYRARAADSQWLAVQGDHDEAATMVSDVFAHFEGALAHEALEEADHEAYEGFESGLSALKSAAGEGDSSGIDEGLSTVDENLVSGIEALAGSKAPLLEAGYFRARLADAYELYQLGHGSAAASVASGLFERFEANELDFHERMETTSEALYHRFEEEHLNGLVSAFEAGNDDGVATHYEGAQSALLDFETQAGSTAAVSGVEAAFMGARGFDAAVLAALGDDERARGIAQGAFEHFEAGAGGYHEALEHADHDVYEAFEDELGAVATAADNGDDVYAAAKSFNAAALKSAYTVVENAGGETGGAATSVLKDTFAHFEEARVHDLIEEADHEAYETFEEKLDEFSETLSEGGDVEAAADTFAKATLYAQFAIVDSTDNAPVQLPLDGSSAESDDGHSDEQSDLEGGPNVVEGVPDDADHVVDMEAVAFAPKELTVSNGDTVAWKHVGGEPHSVTAYEDSIPEDAAYWASGAFESESAATEGWDNGTGAVQSGHSYVHTFETTGTHEYYCVPHEAAGMTGSIIVE